MAADKAFAQLLGEGLVRVMSRLEQFERIMEQLQDRYEVAYYEDDSIELERR